MCQPDLSVRALECSYIIANNNRVLSLEWVDCYWISRCRINGLQAHAACARYACELSERAISSDSDGYDIASRWVDAEDLMVLAPAMFRQQDHVDLNLQYTVLWGLRLP